MTDTEFLKKITDNVDPVDLVELLDLSVEDIVDAFYTEILYQREWLEDFLFANDDDDTLEENSYDNAPRSVFGE